MIIYDECQIPARKAAKVVLYEIVKKLDKLAEVEKLFPGATIQEKRGMVYQLEVLQEYLSVRANAFNLSNGRLDPLRRKRPDVGYKGIVPGQEKQYDPEKEEQMVHHYKAVARAKARADALCEKLQNENKKGKS